MAASPHPPTHPLTHSTNNHPHQMRRKWSLIIEGTAGTESTEQSCKIPVSQMLSALMGLRKNKCKHLVTPERLNLLMGDEAVAARARVERIHREAAVARVRGKIDDLCEELRSGCHVPTQGFG